MANNIKFESIFVIFAATILVVNGQGQTQGLIANIPGASTATQIMASSVDGMSRYFAPDGPIQPALTAISGLPMRGTEYLNKGITSISSGLNNGAQSLSKSAGNNGDVRMPGMDSLRSVMPNQVQQLGQMMRGAIQGKNSFIRGQAEQGVQAGERLRSMMQKGLTSRRKRDTNSVNNENVVPQMNSLVNGEGEIQFNLASDLSNSASNVIPNTNTNTNSNLNANTNNNLMVDPLMQDSTMMMNHGSSIQMMNHMQDTMMKGKKQIKSQLQEHMNGHMSRMQGMQGIGDNLRNQAQGISRTLSSGLQGTMEHLQRTGQQVHQQLEGGLKQNMGSMSGMMNSMQGSMGNMGQHMQKNAEGLMRTAQNAAQQVSSHLQQAASGPLNMLHSLTNSLSSMVQGKMGSMSGGKQMGGSSGGY